LTQDQMQHILFPLGVLTKPEVRTLAKEIGLSVAERSESQEICFVPNNDYRSFLKEYAPEALQPGEMVLTDGTVVGKHEGIAFFTVGQRRRLGYAAGERIYVVRIDRQTHRIVLGKASELSTREFVVSDTHFIPFHELRTKIDVTVKIRYRSRSIHATIKPLNPDRVRVELEQAASGVCPGQHAVFYDGDTVVGGGIIEL